MKRCEHCGEQFADDLSTCPTCSMPAPPAGDTVKVGAGEGSFLDAIQELDSMEFEVIDGDTGESAPVGAGDDIAQFLQEHGLEHLAAKFADQRIDKAALEELSEADLEKLGVDKLGDRKKILAALGRSRSALPAAQKKQAPVTLPTRNILLGSAIALSCCFFVPWTMANGEPVFSWDLMPEAEGVLRLEIVLLPLTAIIFLVLTSIQSMPNSARVITSAVVGALALGLFFASEEMTLLSDAANAGMFGLTTHVMLLYIGLSGLAVAAMVWSYVPTSILARVLSGMSLAAVAIAYFIPLKITGVEATTSLLDIIQLGLSEAEGNAKMFVGYLIVPFVLALAVIPLFWPAEGPGRKRSLYARGLGYATIGYLPAALYAANGVLLGQGQQIFVFFALGTVIAVYGYLFTTGMTALFTGAVERSGPRATLQLVETLGTLKNQGHLSNAEFETMKAKLLAKVMDT